MFHLIVCCKEKNAKIYGDNTQNRELQNLANPFALINLHV